MCGALSKDSLVSKDEAPLLQALQREQHEGRESGRDPGGEDSPGPADLVPP